MKLVKARCLPALVGEGSGDLNTIESNCLRHSSAELIQTPVEDGLVVAIMRFSQKRSAQASAIGAG